MKIAFRIDSGAGIGMGHFTRMSALADAFGEFGGESSFFRSEDEPVDYTGFDLVVADSYLLTDQYIAELNQSGRFVLCYDDNALYEYSCDVLMNANLFATELTYRFGEKVPQLLLGGRYTLLRREFWMCEPSPVKQEARCILVCFGGADILNITPRVVSALQGIPNIEIVAVLGAATSCDEDVYRIAAANTTVVKTPPSMLSVMRDCDIAVISSSTITYEIAALGIPALLIIQAENQELNADYLTKHGLMKCIGNGNDFDTRILVRETKMLIADADRRKNESERLIQSVSKNGALHAAKEIIEMAGGKGK